jgi:hypothetical protein
LDSVSRPWVIDLVKQSAPIAFIPGSGTRHTPSIKAA